jgi:phosphatidylinositol dimannoside acyltransferase
MSGFTEQVMGLAYRAGWRTLRWLPESTATGLFDLFADRAARKPGPATRQLRANLARVVPQAGEVELDELTRQALRSYGRYWKEAFRLPAMDKTDIADRVDAEISGTENIDAALAAGNGVVLALAHTGNFDAAGVWLARHCAGFTTVAQRVRPESLYRAFVDYRTSLGFEVLPLTGGETSTTRTLLRRLRENRVVALVADRDITETGLPVTFFGERAALPGGPAKLAAATGAALLPVGGWFTETGWAYRVHPPIRVTSRRDAGVATQALADVFAGDIAAHPADWHMMQPFWTCDLARAGRGPGSGPDQLAG